LRRQHPGDWPTLEQLAASLRLPASTLRRRLAREGQSYAAIKDEFRRDLALALLLSSEKNIGQIALELGFAEPSAFYRAFRKWTGKSPGAFQRDAGGARR
jgi:AraC-like DNA-binding protein